MLAKAKKIKRRRDPRALAHYPEPKRGKVHWDFLLEEMQWMAKEFARQATRPAFQSSLYSKG